MTDIAANLGNYLMPEPAPASKVASTRQQEDASPEAAHRSTEDQADRSRESWRTDHGHDEVRRQHDHGVANDSHQRQDGQEKDEPGTFRSIVRKTIKRKSDKGDAQEASGKAGQALAAEQLVQVGEAGGKRVGDANQGSEAKNRDQAARALHAMATRTRSTAKDGVKMPVASTDAEGKGESAVKGNTSPASEQLKELAAAAAKAKDASSVKQGTPAEALVGQTRTKATRTDTESASVEAGGSQNKTGEEMVATDASKDQASGQSGWQGRPDQNQALRAMHVNGDTTARGQAGERPQGAKEDSAFKAQLAEGLSGRNEGSQPAGQTQNPQAGSTDFSAAAVETHQSQPVGAIASATAATAGEQTQQAAQPQDVDLVNQMLGPMRAGLQRAGDRITVQLDPPELGQVRVELRADGGSLRGVLRAENPQTLSDLQKEATSLMNRLAESGVQVRRLEVVLDSNPTGRESFDSFYRQGAGQGPAEQSGEQASQGGQQGGESGSSRGTSGGEGLAADAADGASDPDEVITDQSVNIWM